MRRHFSHYFKYLPGFKETRLRLLTSLDVQEIRAILGEIRENWGSCRSSNLKGIYGI
jgi:tRNA-dihydrouridine synthase